jgi:glycosyltransferase involved in cell wall biosynthesis
MLVVRARPPFSWTFAPALLVPVWRSLAQADVVHIHSIHTFPSTVAMILSRLRRVPYIIEPHGALDSYHLNQGGVKKRLYIRVIDAWGIRGLGGAVYSSRREAREGAATLHVDAIRMPLGVDESLFQIERETRGGTTVLYLGRLAKKKRVDLAIRALSEPALHEQNAKLIVAGPLGDDLPYDPVKVAEEAGVSDRVQFVGPVDAEERRQLLAHADVFLIPSEDESFGVALAEAMAAGCAVVASAETGFAPEAAEADALILAPLSPAGVADAVAHALLRRDELGRRGREYAYAHFRWAEAAREVAASYEYLVSRP